MLRNTAVVAQLGPERDKLCVAEVLRRTPEERSKVKCYARGEDVGRQDVELCRVESIILNTKC